MKKTILLTLMSGVSIASMAAGIPDLLLNEAIANAQIAYDRPIVGSGKHVRIYNMDHGYVLTCGEKVVGYSTEGAFSRHTAPPAMLDMLEAMTNDAEVTPSKYTAVEPLKGPHGQIMWNQDAPFNDLCPMYDLTQRCPTGCVATAMAQVMYYHQWPPKGKGSHTYSPAVMVGNTLTADFENTTYKWDAMLPDYFSGKTAEGYTEAESSEAVAQLMLHCGVAVDMVYYTQSGALDYDVPPALINYFGYDEGMAYRKREHYDTDEWLTIINDELKAGRMILAYGRASTGGHAYVFDGMDADGFIHVNWGWGGMSNGYFSTSALTPASQGIGGSDGGFNYSQRIITGIKPAVEGKPSSPHVELTSTEGLNAGKKKIQQGADVNIKLSGKITNQGWQESTFDYALILLTEDGETVKVIEGPTEFSLEKDKSLYAPNFGAVNFGTIPEGNYRLYPACRASHTTGEWIKIHDSYIGYPNYLRVSATATEVSFEAPDYFELRAFDTEVPTTIYAGVPTLITTSVVNEGDAPYHGEVKAVLRRANKTEVASTTNYIIDLAPGESTNIRFTDPFTATPGAYTLVLIDDDGQALSSPADVEVINAPYEGTVTSATEMTIESNSAAAMTVKATVKVEGGTFYGLLYAYIYSADGHKLCGCLFPEYLSITDTEQKEIRMTGTFENGEPGRKYLMRLATYNGQKTTLLDDDMSTLPFTFMQSESISDIEADDSTEYIYYDVLGRRVGSKNLKTYKKLSTPK